jgi:hypothetical protein
VAGYQGSQKLSGLMRKWKMPGACNGLRDKEHLLDIIYFFLQLARLERLRLSALNKLSGILIGKR